MDHTTLAQRFDDTAQMLGRAGHGVLVRRARALMAFDDPDEVIAFLKEAAQRSALPSLGHLAAAVENWALAGNEAAGLESDPAWRAGTASGEQAAREIAALTDGADLETLMQHLTELQRAQAAEGSPRSTGPQAIGSIFGSREQHAVEEAQTVMQSKPLVIEDAPRSSAPPVPIGEPSTAPPRPDMDTASVPLSPEVIEDTVVTDPPFEDEADAEQGVDPLAAVEASAIGEAAAPELPPPPPPPPQEIEVQPPTDLSAEENDAGIWIIIAVVIVLAVVLLLMGR